METRNKIILQFPESLTSTFPNAFVITKPGDFSCPQFRPFVNILETRTIFLMLPVFFAASINLMVPMLSYKAKQKWVNTKNNRKRKSEIREPWFVDRSMIGSNDDNIISHKTTELQSHCKSVDDRDNLQHHGRRHSS